MPAIGIALLWGAYFGGLWGYCLIRGYNVTPKQLLSATWPPVPQGAANAFGSGVQAAESAGAQGAGQTVGGFLNGYSGGTGPNKAQ